jgi:hypothetical protein
MRKERRVPSILKPVIDEKTALEFAATVSTLTAANKTDQSAGAPARKSVPHKQSDSAVGKNMVQLSIVIKKSLYERIAKDAARKNRTVDEHLKRHLAKRYGK